MQNLSDPFETLAREGEREVDVVPRQVKHEGDDGCKEARTRANTGSEQARLEARPRVGPTEGTQGRLTALEGTFPGNLYLAIWNPKDRGKTGIKKMTPSLKIPYAPREYMPRYSPLRTASR
jgi:hypothetical protein